jgi:hypothetical protein
MVANAIPTAQLKVKAEKCAIENEKDVKQSASAPLKQRVAKVLHEVFEGHEGYLGMTPD